MVTEKDSGPRRWLSVAKRAARPAGKSAGRVGEARWWGPCGPNPVIPCFREKPRCEGLFRPYPKPTLVVWQSMPRRSRESWPRNSANRSRTFGIREPAPGFPLLRGAAGRGGTGQGVATVY